MREGIETRKFAVSIKETLLKYYTVPYSLCVYLHCSSTIHTLLCMYISNLRAILSYHCCDSLAFYMSRSFTFSCNVIRQRQRTTSLDVPTTHSIGCNRRNCGDNYLNELLKLSKDTRCSRTGYAWLALPVAPAIRIGCMDIYMFVSGLTHTLSLFLRSFRFGFAGST